MIRALLLLALLAGCGGQPGPQQLADAFGEAGVPLSERALNDGTPAWSSDTDENVIIEVKGDPVQTALVWVPALGGSVDDGFPGSRYVEVLEDRLAPGLMEWIAEEAAGRSSGDWTASREFGQYTVELDNDPSTLGSFTVTVTTPAGEEADE